MPASVFYALFPPELVAPWLIRMERGEITHGMARRWMDDRLDRFRRFVEDQCQPLS